MKKELQKKFPIVKLNVILSNIERCMFPFLGLFAINYDGAYAALFQYVNFKTCIRKAISA